MSQPIDTNRIRDAHGDAWYAQNLVAIDGVNIRFRVMRDTMAQFHRHSEGPE